MASSPSKLASLPAELHAEDVLLLVDSREQQPLHLTGFQTKVAGLPEGDYCLASSPQLAVAERKASCSELATCAGRERERFERELVRLRGYPHRVVVCEFSWADVEAFDGPGEMTPAMLKGAIAAWTARYVPFALVGSRAGAEDFLRRWFMAIVRSRWREVREWTLGVRGEVADV